MPAFRCPKCRAILNTAGSRPTVSCAQCGQLCAIPVQAKPTNSERIQSVPPPPPRAPEPEPIVLEEVLEPEEEILDVIELSDEPARGQGSPDFDRRRKRQKKPRKKGPEYKKPIWYHDEDERNSGWITPGSIITGVLCLFGFGIMCFLSYLPSGGTLLIVYGILIQMVGILWGIGISGGDGEGTRAFFWVHRWIYLFSNLDRGLYPLVLEFAGIFFMLVGWAVRLSS
jgi:hypothetical protein